MQRDFANACLRTKQCPAHGFLPCTTQSGEAQYFTFMSREFRWPSAKRFEIDGTQCFLAALQAGPNVEIFHFAPDDHAHEFGRCCFLNGLHTHQSAISKHRHPVSDAENFIQAVRHVNHASAPATQITENFEHTLNFIGGETCGRLIQHQYIGFDSESPGDCNK